MPPFGECILYLPAGKRGSKLDEKYVDGIFLGIVERSSEIYVGTAAGVVRGRSLRRRPPSERSNEEFLLAVRGTPWCAVPGSPGSDEVPVIVGAAPVVAEDVLPAGPGVHVPEERRLCIRKNFELVKHGCTEGCQGCNAARAGSAARAHSS